VPTVLLVRHAQASFGSADYDVFSPLGIEQTAVLAAALARRKLNVTRIAAGTARRQRETAAPVAAELGLEIETDERWNEYETEEVLAHHAREQVSLEETGPGGGKITSRDFQKVLDAALDDWVEAGAETDAGQTWPQFFASRSEAMRDLGAGLGSGETGIAFTSGGAIAAVCARLLQLHADLFPPLNRVLANTGITKITIGRSGPSLVTFNEHAHIDEAEPRLLTYR
jgi:broad specificity phosphatase PhoE